MYTERTEGHCIAALQHLQQIAEFVRKYMSSTTLLLLIDQTYSKPYRKCVGHHVRQHQLATYHQTATGLLTLQQPATMFVNHIRSKWMPSGNRSFRMVCHARLHLYVQKLQFSSRPVHCRGSERNIIMSKTCEIITRIVHCGFSTIYVVKRKLCYIYIYIYIGMI